MLAALAPATLARLRFPLGELTKPRGARAGRRGRAAGRRPRPTPRTCASWPAPARPRFLARHGGLAERPGDLVDRAGRVLGRHRGHHRFTVGQREGLRRRRAASRSTCCAKDAATNRVTVGPRERSRPRAVAVRGARLHRAGAEVDAVKLRYRSRAVACRVAGDPAPGAHRRLELELADPVDGAAPGQIACLLRGDVRRRATGPITAAA